MAIRKIAQIGHPVLRQKARDVSKSELASVEETRPEESQERVLLVEESVKRERLPAKVFAYTSRSEPIRICAIEVRDNPRYPYKPKIPLTILVNPVLTPEGDETFENYEGCLSVPNLRGRVRRAVHLRCQAWDRHGNPIDEVVHGLKAGTYQHEVDHLDGVIFVDRVADPRTLATWTEFDRHHKAAFVDEVTALVARVGS